MLRLEEQMPNRQSRWLEITQLSSGAEPRRGRNRENKAAMEVALANQPGQFHTVPGRALQSRGRGAGPEMCERS